jgi:hypothetical protein
LILEALSGAEAPLFYGTARICEFFRNLLSDAANLLKCIVPSGAGKRIFTNLSTICDFCEPTMNFTCGKPNRHPRTKPVIAGDTTYGVSLLTGTISGSNFAIP